MPWKEKMRKIRGAVAEATAGVAVAVHELESRIGVGAPVRRMERMGPTKDQARHLVDQLLLWDRMGVSVLVVVASLQIVYKTKTFPASITTTGTHFIESSIFSMTLGLGAQPHLPLLPCCDVS
jgi:hypothetical protein